MRYAILGLAGVLAIGCSGSPALTGPSSATSPTSAAAATIGVVGCTVPNTGGLFVSQSLSPTYTLPVPLTPVPAGGTWTLSLTAPTRGLHVQVEVYRTTHALTGEELEALPSTTPVYATGTIDTSTPQGFCWPSTLGDRFYLRARVDTASAQVMWLVNRP